MRNIENECWSDSRPYYILYQDKMFLKDIYAQLFVEFPDVGEIAYIGASTHKFTKEYSIDGEQANSNDNRRKLKNNELENNKRDDCRKKARLNICDTNEESQIREYANIKEIKEMNNILFYKRLVRQIALECTKGKCSNLCYIKDKVQMYDKYKESQDVFVKMGKSCVWLKSEYMDTTALNIANVMGTVNMIGYVLEEESENSPKVIKAIAIYT